MHLRSGEGGKRIRWIGGALKQGGLVILFHLLRLSLAGDWHVGTEYLRYLLGGGGGVEGDYVSSPKHKAVPHILAPFLALVFS